MTSFYVTNSSSSSSSIVRVEVAENVTTRYSVIRANYNTEGQVSKWTTDWTKSINTS